MLENIAKSFVAFYRSDNPMDKYSLYSDQCVSVENSSINGIFQTYGIENIKEKGLNFYKQFSKILERNVSDPEITDEGFVVFFDIKGLDQNGNVLNIHEKAIYKISDAKIIREEFIY